MGISARIATWKGFPLAFLGYGFLYAWGYVSWCTESLATRSVSGAGYDPSWLVSAIVVPFALLALALVGRRVDLEHNKTPYVAAPASAIVGTVFSVVYQHVPNEGVALLLAALSGLGTGIGSALFNMLWGIALSRLNIATLEVAVPVSFIVSTLCTLVAPSLAMVPALVVALLLVGLCTVSLAWCRHRLAQGAVGAQWLEETRPSPHSAPVAEDVPGIARMLAFGIAAWTIMNIVPMEGPTGGLSIGIDASGAVGYLLAIVVALTIIRYAVRVDFQALALMTLPLLVLSLTLLAAGGTALPFWANALNVALNSCCEIILLLFFVRIAQARSEPRAFWLALGSSASYLGVLLGQVGSVLCVRSGIAADNLSLLCLTVVCVYTFAMLLIPQRAGEASTSAQEHPAFENMPRTAASLGGPGYRPRYIGADAEVGANAPQSSPDAISLACIRLAEKFQLSTRETEICSFLAHGRSQTYIRDALFLSKNTVATHVRRLYVKLGIHSKQELIDLVETTLIYIDD